MRVHIIGPNLPDQTKGSFHIHAEGCEDVKRSRNYRGPEFESDRANTVDVESLTDVIAYTMADQLDEEEDDFDPLTWSGDFYVFPCVTGLPDRNEGNQPS